MAHRADISAAAARSHVYAFLAQAFAEPEPATLAWLRQALHAAESALTAIGATESCAALADVRRAYEMLRAMLDDA